MEARGIYWLIVALHGITPEEIETVCADAEKYGAYLTSRYLGGGTMPETACSDALGAVDGAATPLRPPP